MAARASAAAATRSMRALASGDAAAKDAAAATADASAVAAIAAAFAAAPGDGGAIPLPLPPAPMTPWLCFLTGGSHPILGLLIATRSGGSLSVAMGMLAAAAVSLATIKLVVRVLLVPLGRRWGLGGMGGGRRSVVGMGGWGFCDSREAGCCNPKLDSMSYQ